MISRLSSTLLAILALTVGLWGVGTLLVSLHIMTNDLSENYSQTVPINIAIKSEDFNKLNLEELRRNSDIMAAELRDKSILRIEVHPDEWLNLWLYSVDNFEQLTLGKIFRQSGSFPPSRTTILIERNNLLVSNFKVGSVARVQSNGKVIDTKISGIVYDPAQAPSTQDAIIYGYTSKANYSRLSGKDAGQRLIIRFNNVATKQDVKAKFEALSDEFTRLGIKIDSFEIPKFDEHPHQFQLNTLLNLNGAIGLLAFIMAMVLMSQLMSSIFTQQIRQIGIMKAIGATQIHIFKSYIAYIMTMSFFSILIGLPLAIMTGKTYSAFVAGILNFDVLTTQMPPAIYIVITTLGFALPIIFSLPALVKGTKISVNDALGDYGLSTSDGSALGKTIGSTNFNILSLSIRNVGRRKGRMIVTMASMALGVAIFQSGFNVRASLIDFLDNTSRSMKYDIKVVLGKNLAPKIASAPYKNIAAIKSIEGWIGGVGRVQSGVVSTASGIGLIIAPYDTKLKDYDLMQGTWLTGSQEWEFVVNQQAAFAFKPLVIGKIYPIDFGNSQVSAKLVGVVREFDAAKIYLDLNKYNSLLNPDNKINSLMISLNDRSFDNVIKVKKEIEHAIEETGTSVLYVMSQAERADIIFRHLNIILMIILFLSLLVLTVSAMGMGSAMGINVIERTREIGVLRAIGATPKKIIQLFVVEGIFIVMLSVAVGLLLALPMSSLAANFFGELILGENTPLDFAFSELGFGITLVVTFLFGYIASRLPARKATNITLREAIAYE
jgi:putative ABC transport system permease protein